MMNRDKSIEAVFGTRVNTSVSGGGTIIKYPTALFYPYGSTYTLSAEPTGGNFFSSWNGSAQGQANPMQLSITNSNPTILGAFSQLPVGNYSLIVRLNGPGQIKSSTNESHFSGGQTLTLTAAPALGQDFLGWSGDEAGTNNPLLITMLSNKVVTGNFTRRPRFIFDPAGTARQEAGFRLSLQGELGAVYGVDHASDWGPWKRMVFLTNNFGTVQFVILSVTSGVLNLYRALLVQ